MIIQLSYSRMRSTSVTYVINVSVNQTHISSVIDVNKYSSLVKLLISFKSSKDI